MAPRGRASKAFVALALAAGVAAAAADVFQQYGLDRQAWSDSFVNSITDRALYAPSLTAKLKGVPPGQRAAVVNALGAAAKAFVGSPEFKARYAKEYEASLPDDLRPPRSAAEIEASTRAEMRKGLTEMEATVKELQGESRKQAEAALAQVRAELDRQMATAGQGRRRAGRRREGALRGREEPAARPRRPLFRPAGRAPEVAAALPEGDLGRRFRRRDPTGVEGAPLREARLRSEAPRVEDVLPRRAGSLRCRSRVRDGMARGAEVGISRGRRRRREARAGPAPAELRPGRTPRGGRSRPSPRRSRGGRARRSAPSR